MFSFSAGPGTMSRLVANMDLSNEPFSSWNDVMAFAAHNPSGYRTSPVKWSYHIDRAFNLGNQIVGPQQVVGSKILIRIKNAKRRARRIALSHIK